MNGCSLVDCLKYFTAVEHVDNYRCDRCWHMAAAEHLSLKSKVDEEKISKLHACVNYDICSCKPMFGPEEITYSTPSHALKQLVITQCPKILCIHLQRASVGLNGELLKCEGHISFPLLLNLSPFAGATSSLRQEPSTMDIQRQCQHVHLFRQLNMQMHMHTFPVGGNSSSQLCKDELTTNGGNSSEKKANVDVAANSSSLSRSKLYGLSAVVEHYGRCGGGHYAVYRRVKPDSDGADPAQHLASFGRLWFYISDRHVSQVSEDDVFAAEATLLFYERL